MEEYRKKPVVITAEQWDGHSMMRGICRCSGIPSHLHTIHANQVVELSPGDWILPEPDGVHFYPCKPDIFEATYEPAPAPLPTEDEIDKWVDARIEADPLFNISTRLAVKDFANWLREALSLRPDEFGALRSQLAAKEKELALRVDSASELRDHLRDCNARDFQYRKTIATLTAERDAARKAIRKNHLKYTPGVGISCIHCHRMFYSESEEEHESYCIVNSCKEGT